LAIKVHLLARKASLLNILYGNGSAGIGCGFPIGGLEPVISREINIMMIVAA